MLLFLYFIRFQMLNYHPLHHKLNTVCYQKGGEYCSDIAQTSEYKSSDEATKSSPWNGRESTEHVFNLTASTRCLFCEKFLKFYFPKSKIISGLNGHLKPEANINLKYCKYDFYSHSNRSTNSAQNESVDNIPTNVDIENTTQFDYCFDPNNLISRQQYQRDPHLFNEEFLLREGIPHSILKHCDLQFARIRFNCSTSGFVFKNTNSVRYRLFKKLKTTQNIRDIYYWQFSQYIKDFIAFCIKHNSINFLNVCIENNLIPKKFRKRIDIERKHQTKLIRKDCITISKHLMEQTINQTRGDIVILEKKFRGYIGEKFRDMDIPHKTLLYQFLINIRNVCAFVCSLKHNHKIATLSQNTPHICVTFDNVIDVALKSDIAKVDQCQILHFSHLYWHHRECTLESFLLDLAPLEGEGISTEEITQQVLVWETYLSKVTKSKSLVPEKKHIVKDFKDDWNKFLYGFRWSQNINIDHSNSNCNLDVIDQTNYIPYQKPSISLPSRSNPEAEIFLATLKLAINKQLTDSWDQFDADTQDGTLTQGILQSFLTVNDYRVVSSDKTNRCLLIKNNVYIELGEKFLNQSKDYLLLSRDPNKILLDKANSIINAIKKTNHTFRKGDLDKLIKYEPSPAKLSFLIKDHKDKDGEGNFPLRPLANINGSSLDSLDWVLAKILNQGLKLVSYNIWNSQQILRTIPKINNRPIAANYIRKAISLDVVGLYPSVPLIDACNLVFRFIKDNNSINTFGIPYPIIKEIMITLTNNYNIEFNQRVYKQTKGVPMGARFSCAFSIIFMHIIEKTLIEQWFRGDVLEGFNLVYYGRYIDDVVIIFDQPLDVIDLTPILTSFNALHRAIKFTLEVADHEGHLPFLDMTLYIDTTGKLLTTWYMKPQHSGNFIKGNEYMPENVKRNTIIERFRAIMIRSSDSAHSRESINKMVGILVNNQHTVFKIMGAIRQAFVKNDYSITTPFNSADNDIIYDYDWKIVKNENFDNRINEFEPPKPILKVPYVGESMKHSITQVLKRFGREQQVRVVYTSNKRIKHLKPEQSDNNAVRVDQPDYCVICQNITGGDQYHCATRIVVYQFQCKICQATYIGKTNKTVKERITNHFTLFRKKSNTSPLWMHEFIFHAGATIDNLSDLFERYSLKILSHNKEYVLNNIAEAELISREKPLINRREEVPEWDIDAAAIDLTV